jgi:hypothetical protein
MTLPNGQPVSLGIRDKVAIGTFTLMILASLCAVWLRQETLLQELISQQRLLEYRVGQLENTLDSD